MKNLNTKNLLAASVASLITVNTFATPADVDKALTVTFTHPQSVAIETAAGSDATASANTGAATATTWKVNSNNAVKVKFTGTSYNTSGGSTSTPILAKQEVNAKNKKISGAYDQLTTEFGVVLTGTSSTEKDTVSWGGGANPTGESTSTGVGTPTNLINTAGNVGPTETFGAVMPADDGTFTYTLYTKGTGDTSSTQSGAYSAVITTTITAQEKDGSAGTE
ncbi:MAG: hypothetical protein NZ824_00355 [Candidatus Thioglobus sp.]|nr:hypothetical protein [Candidatus Thioglobus sp.]